MFDRFVLEFWKKKFPTKGFKSLTRVFDPLDGECKYTQNPTEQSKTVDNGLRPLCEDVPNNSNLRQEH